jgi:glycosyltransferase involved in cell wall biosynthesis
LVNSDLRILFCGMLKSPFILQDLELLQQYYKVIPVNLDIVNDKREGIFIFIWSLITSIVFKFYKIDVVYIWFADIHALPLIVVSKLFRKRVILTVGGWEVANYPDISYGNQLTPWRGAVTRWCIRHASIVLVPSNAYKIITKSLVPRSNVCVIPNAIDISLCEHQLPVKSNIVVTALCTLHFTSILKGIPIFKEAAKKVPYECIVYERLKHKILMEKLREAKVYCQLSYTESFGITNLEAMACGCVPIVTDRDALPEIIGNTGVVVPYGDVEATVKAIYIAMTMDGNAARERAKLFVREERLKLLSNIIENNYIDVPLVSVVIPSYNSAQWLPNTIGSILKQTYPKIEIILVDDCSTDNTYEIVSQYPMVKYLKNSINMGECITSRRGFEESTGDYICRLSADDMYANPDKIKHQVEIMEKTGVDWSYNSINCVGSTLETAKTHNYFWMILPTRYGNRVVQLFDNYILKFPHFVFLRIFLGNPVNSSTLMFRRSSYMKSTKWTDKFRTDCDGLLLFNLFLNKFTCIAIHELGSFYRLHPNQATNIATTYHTDMREIRLEIIDKVLTGDYPFWLKYAVKNIRRKLYGF